MSDNKLYDLLERWASLEPSECQRCHKPFQVCFQVRIDDISWFEVDFQSFNAEWLNGRLLIVLTELIEKKNLHQSIKYYPHLNFWVCSLPIAVSYHSQTFMGKDSSITISVLEAYVKRLGFIKTQESLKGDVL